MAGKSEKPAQSAGIPFLFLFLSPLLAAKFLTRGDLRIRLALLAFFVLLAAAVLNWARRGPEERRLAETVYPMVQDSIRDGIYPPHRSSPLCSSKHCGYWRECEREFGGRVPE